MNEREISLLKGLSKSEVDERVKQFGYNELKDTSKRSIFKIILLVFAEPMFLLLLACGVIYLIVGEPNDAIILLGFVLIMMVITVVQEGKTERTLDSLRHLASPRALVIRAGERTSIASRELVPDDLVVIAEGERISADESLLSGESVPVRKQAVETMQDAKSDMVRPGGEDSPCVYAG